MGWWRKSFAGYSEPATKDKINKSVHIQPTPKTGSALAPCNLIPTLKIAQNELNSSVTKRFHASDPIIWFLIIPHIDPYQLSRRMVFLYLCIINFRILKANQNCGKILPYNTIQYFTGEKYQRTIRSCDRHLPGGLSEKDEGLRHCLAHLAAILHDRPDFHQGAANPQHRRSRGC